MSNKNNLNKGIILNQEDLINAAAAAGNKKPYFIVNEGRVGNGKVPLLQTSNDNSPIDAGNMTTTGVTSPLLDLELRN